jgi:adenylate cyclase
VVGVTHFLALLAEVHGLAGQVEHGLQAADEAHALALATGNRYLEPDIHRVRGELLARGATGPRVPRLRPGSPPDDAEACLQRALDLARRRGVKSLELRAATSLARLWHERGDDGRAGRLLGALCRWFTEGGDTADLQAARQLVSALSPTPPRRRAHPKRRSGPRRRQRGARSRSAVRRANGAGLRLP